MIRLNGPVVRALGAHAATEYPSECCGLVLGTEDPQSWLVRPCRNIQNELHEKDPVAYPRDARTAYTMSPEDMEFLFQADFEDPGQQVVGLYHSHPDNAAYFSEKDREEALVGWIEPEPFYLVLSVYRHRVLDWKAFRYVENENQFEECQLVVEPA